MFAESPIIPEVAGAARVDPAAFIASLTDDLDRGSIEVLGYPDVAVRVQRALAHLQELADMLRVLGCYRA